MDIRDYLIKEKSDIDKTKDKIWGDIMKQQGFYDSYYLGQISVIELLVNIIDKEYATALLNTLAESKDTSDTIKTLARSLIEKYEKPAKYEL